MRTHPHAEATSRVVARAGGTFGVEVVIPPPRLQPKRGSRGTNGASDRRAVGEMVPQDPIEYGEQPSRGSRAEQDRLDQPVRRRRTRGQLRNSGGNSFSAPQAEQIAVSTATRCLGPIPDAITKPQLPQR